MEVYYLALSPVGNAAVFALLFYIGFFQIALFNIITGYFVDEAMRKAAPDKETMMLYKRAEEFSVRAELRQKLQELRGSALPADTLKTSSSMNNSTNIQN